MVTGGPGRGRWGVSLPGPGPAMPPCPQPRLLAPSLQSKSWYRAKHHASGQEGLLAAGALREREALSADPKLSLMP